jgi:glucokinase
MILAGDIGGTHARLGLFERAGSFTPTARATYLTREASGFEELIRRFITEHPVKNLSSACFAIAGPIRNGRCQMTNVPWTVDARELGKRLAISNVTLINDIEAHAMGLPLLRSDDLVVLQQGLQQTGTKAMAFAGTGLGEAGIFWHSGQFYPIAGEGGHVDFAPRNELEIELFLHLQKHYGHVSYERVLSGAGLVAIYQFLIATHRARASKAVQSDMEKKAPSYVITEWGKTGQDEACAQTLGLFLSIYGAEAGNMALKFLSVGGVYIGGGIAANLVEAVKKSSFLASFSDKGRFQGLLESIPVSLVLSDQSALLGAAYNGMK